ncbi:FAD-binding oxidoreductase [Candidatus Leptofilum sp.]|uniref:FAD-binding oxidoreductase n=1 Tax=Candidatus Leptofilum sp. TaxID=3241576 RepID=UPI003B5A9E13
MTVYLEQERKKVSETAVISFAHALKGRLIRRGYSEYDEARAVWNGMIDRYPLMIAHCASVDDVVTAVNFAREQKLPVAVRGGGHNVAGHATCDDGLVIDLSGLKQIEVDVDQRTARAGGGVTWGELDAATQPFGLATPGGVFSDTGIAGLTLGGGYGWLRNMYGLSCDNLLAAEVVTADGRIVHASETENRELLWGLRGGGGNFGIVTSFTFQLHPVGPEVMFVFALHDGSGDKMKHGLEYYREYTAFAPNEVSTLLALGKVPPEEHLFPKAIHGKPFVLMGGLYVGSVADGKKALQPLLDFGEPLIDFSGPTTYIEAQQAFDEDYPDGMRYYWKSLNLSHLDEAGIETIVRHAQQQVSPLSTVDVWHIGGAIREFGAEDGAFNGRQSAFLLGVEGNWEDAADDAANIAWVQDIIDAMAPFSDGSRYLNFAGFQEEGDAMMRDAYGSQYARLVALKKQYDPTNFFSLNQNIKPE